VFDAASAIAGVPKGAYSMTPEVTKADVILLAAGSEVSVCLKAAAELKAAEITAKVVSMPSFRIFDEQSAAYKAELLPEGVPKISLEAGATMGWWKYIGTSGVAIGIDRFGASAPGPIAMEKLGINVANVVEHAKKLVKK
jgi:transketolase